VSGVGKRVRGVALASRKWARVGLGESVLGQELGEELEPGVWDWCGE
jgi:hypothetical protein